MDNANDKRKLEDVIPIKRKSNLPNLFLHFWNLWRVYLTSLREFQITKKRNSAKIRVGNVVTEYEKHQPGQLWRLGPVI